MKLLTSITSVLALLVALCVGCSKDKLQVFNKDFSIEVRQPQGSTEVRVGQAINLQLQLKGYDTNNQQVIDTYFYVKNAQGEATKGLIKVDNNTIALGQKFDYDYRAKQMLMDFTYTPTEEGEQNLYIEVRSAGEMRSVTFPINMKEKSVLVSTTRGGRVSYLGNRSTTHSLSFKYGVEITLQALPDGSYSFSGWFENDQLVSKSENYTFVVNRDVNLEARFIDREYTIKVSTDTPDAGTPELTPHNKELFLDGDQATINFNKSKYFDGYEFLGWYDEDGVLFSKQLNYSWTARRSVDLVAKFKSKRNHKYLNPQDTHSIPYLAKIEDENKDGVYSYGEKITVYSKDLRQYATRGRHEANLSIRNGSEPDVFQRIDLRTLNAPYIISHSFICRGDFRVTLVVRDLDYVHPNL